MLLFQNSGITRAYFQRLRRLTRDASSYTDQLRIFLDDRYGASHFLKPILDGDPDAFFTNGDDDRLQRAWANENGLKASVNQENILLAQIEAHRTEVFYNIDPVRYPSSFVAKLPACVKHTIAWRAAPSGNTDFGAYDAIVCNFPSIIAGYRKIGWRGRYFAPAHDPEMDAYAANEIRPIDVLFVGGYTRHHKNRAVILDAVAQLRGEYNIEFCLDRSRLTVLAETPLGWAGPLAAHRRPTDIRAVSVAPVFGRQLYEKLARAKIVLNGAIDMAGDDRGNMRCWEAMGCGAALLSDEGVYPEGLKNQSTIATYASATDAVSKIHQLVGSSGALSERASEISKRGYDFIRTLYSKERQWAAFQALL